ncbi:MAG: UvrD-helicase domain-containing protein [Chitinispirillaceae bacterium]|nr:UvrD-helicase domain-containing protein [Chitinispirillaceae bacterium]
MIDTESGILSRLVLNSVQQDAVLYEGGPQLVFAGAGTGKTRVLTAKIAWLIDRGIPPANLFAATFTNKAAHEMRSRVERFIRRPTGGMWIGTFHSLCARLLRSECGRIGYESVFSIFDTADQTMLLRKLVQQLGIGDRTASPRQIIAHISRFKSQCVAADEALKKAVGFYEQELARIYTLYQQTLRRQQAMDFDDLLMNTVILLREHHDVLERYRQRFDYILVDEYQDTNTAQRHLLQLLAGHRQRIFAVGDDDQSIYGWRGAQVENILMFEKHFPATKVFKLEQNYRSTGAILDFANAAIVGNTGRAEKKLWTDVGKGGRVTVTRYRDDRHEAQAVGERIKKTCGGKVRRGDIAVLFRTNAQSRVFEEAFRKEHIPYVLVGGISFYERAEIRDCLSYLRLLINPCDNVSFERIYNVPPRGLGEKALETLSQKAAERGASLLETLCATDPQELGNRSKKGFSELKELFALMTGEAGKGASPYELLKEVLQLSGYMDLLADRHTEEASGRAENINELLNALVIWTGENPGGNLASFLEEVSLASDVDTWEQKEDAVNVMTLHCAKGLEFGQVFLVGLEEGLLPSRQNFDDEMKIEEERRLLYVGATRAKERLYCSYADRRYRFGELLPQSPSRFLRAIGPSTYDMDDQTGNFGAVSSPKPVLRVARREGVRFTRADIPVGGIRRKPIFIDDDFTQEVVEYRMGQYVRHKNYGRGRIVSISGFGSDMKVMVLFNDGTRRRLMAKFANFERD